jgi:hypothetical protein
MITLLHGEEMSIALQDMMTVMIHHVIGIEIVEIVKGDIEILKNRLTIEVLIVIVVVVGIMGLQVVEIMGLPVVENMVPVEDMAMITLLPGIENLGMIIEGVDQDDLMGLEVDLGLGDLGMLEDLEGETGNVPRLQNDIVVLLQI